MLVMAVIVFKQTTALSLTQVVHSVIHEVSVLTAAGIGEIKAVNSGIGWYGRRRMSQNSQRSVVGSSSFAIVKAPQSAVIGVLYWKVLAVSELVAGSQDEV